MLHKGHNVLAGTQLIKFDKEKIKAAGHPDVTVCIITEEGNAKNIQFHIGMDVKEKETRVAEWR